MQVINASNVNEALHLALMLFRNPQAYALQDSRNGPVMVLHEPVTTVYTEPLLNVLLSPTRDANPFFHFYESLWMLAGRNDVGSLSRIVKRMNDFSDNGTTFHGAYGYRWRRHFGYDQLSWIINELRANPESRRCVLAMWDGGQFHDFGDDRDAVTGSGDLYAATHGGKDVPCNTHVYFRIVTDGSLDMTVCNRSNDALLGCYGANAVHFAMLLAYVAAGVGVRPGVYRQVSNNLHIYTAEWTPEKLALIEREALRDTYRVNVLSRDRDGRYLEARINPFIGGTFDAWGICCERLTTLWADAGGDQMRLYDTHSFFDNTATPMMAAHYYFKKGLFDRALQWAAEVSHPLWSTAAAEWLLRRNPAMKTIKEHRNAATKG